MKLYKYLILTHLLLLCTQSYSQNETISHRVTKTLQVSLDFGVQEYEAEPVGSPQYGWRVHEKNEGKWWLLPNGDQIESNLVFAYPETGNFLGGEITAYSMSPNGGSVTIPTDPVSYSYRSYGILRFGAEDIDFDQGASFYERSKSVSDEVEQEEKSNPGSKGVITIGPGAPANIRLQAGFSYNCLVPNTQEVRDELASFKVSGGHTHKYAVSANFEYQVNDANRKILSTTDWFNGQVDQEWTPFQDFLNYARHKLIEKQREHCKTVKNHEVRFDIEVGPGSDIETMDPAPCKFVKPRDSVGPPRASIDMDGVEIYTASPGYITFQATIGEAPILILPIVPQRGESEAWIEVLFENESLGVFPLADLIPEDLNFLEVDISGIANREGELTILLDTDGVESAQIFLPTALNSNELIESFTGEEIPDQPHSLSATAGDFDDRVQLSWNVGQGTTGFKVYRGTTNSIESAEQIHQFSDTVVETEPGAIWMWEDQTVVPDIEYYYWIEAFHQGGLESSMSLGKTEVAMGYAVEPNPNQAPLDVNLSNDRIAEDQVPETLIGELVVSDPDPNDVHTFELVSVDGGALTGFRIESNSLILNTLLDYETVSEYIVRIRATDSGGLTFEKDLVIYVDDVDDVDETIEEELPNFRRAIIQNLDSVQIELTISPEISTSAYAVEESLPSGFTASNVNEFGVVDTVNRKIKWGPFLENQSRTFSYTLTAPDNYSGALALNGWASLDGIDILIEGDRLIVFANNPDATKGERLLQQNGEPIEVTLSIRPSPATSTYAVEELIPEGFTAISISDEGSIDLLNNKIKWGPFFDNSTRSLTYFLLPPDDFTGMIHFAGFVSMNGQNHTVGGELSMEIDYQGETAPTILTQPVGGEVTLGESFTFSVAVSGSVTSYQWFKDTQSITGANLPFLILNEVLQQDLGEYYVQIVGPGGSVISDPVLLRQADLSPEGPRIDPESITFINIGNLQQMALTSSSTPSKTYQVVMKSDLNDPEWIPVGPMQIANDTTVTFLIDVTNFETGFFQVREN